MFFVLRCAGAQVGAPSQCFLKVGGPAVFFEQVTKSLVREFLKGHHTIACKLIERCKILRLEFDDLAFHGAGERRSARRFGRAMPITRAVMWPNRPIRKPAIAILFIAAVSADLMGSRPLLQPTTVQRKEKFQRPKPDRVLLETLRLPWLEPHQYGFWPRGVHREQCIQTVCLWSANDHAALWGPASRPGSHARV